MRQRDPVIDGNVATSMPIRKDLLRLSGEFAADA
jgi:hypothetical protein